RLIATWNPVRSVWETDLVALYCGHSVPYPETWPAWGMTRSGAAYELPMWERRTTGSESSLLPTPLSTDGHGPGVHGQGGQDLRAVVALLPTPDAYSERGDVATNLLPTPRATDGTKGGPNQRGTGGDLMLPSAVHRLELGASTNPLSDGGNESSADPPPLPLWPDDEDSQS